MTAQALDRRPIAARKLGASRALASALARAGVTPNQLSLAGMLSGVASGVALGFTPLAPGVWWRVLFACAAVLILLRLLCNMLDGMVAVARGTCSPLGELYNEIPDRVSDSATLVGLGFALGGQPLLGFTAALLAMFTAYIRAMGKAAGGPQQFCGPMSKPQRMFTAAAAALFCALAPAAWQPAVGVPALALLLVCAGAALACLRRLSRVASALKGARP